MRLRLSLAGAVLGLGLAGGTATADEPDTAVARIVEGNSLFADEVQRILTEGPEERGKNFVFSPHSLRLALAVVREGARGRTAEELDALLHLPPEGTGDGFLRLTDTVASPLQTYQLHMAAGYWADRSDPPGEAFDLRLREGYGIAPQLLDFGDGAAARGVIHRWIAEATRGMISEIVPDGEPTRSTQSVIVSAVAFEARWDHEFGKDQPTRAKPFHRLDGTNVAAPTMITLASISYGRTESAQVIDLPYAGGKAFMRIVLPSRLGGRLPTDAWEIPTMRRGVHVELPRFRFTRSFDLVGHLARLAAASAASPSAADFRGIASSGPLFLGSILHKVHVAVEEGGTRAAAATAVAVTRGGNDTPEWEEDFVADRPFFFRIVHAHTGLVLFSGKVEDPTAR